MTSIKLIIGIHPNTSGKESYSEKWKQYIQLKGHTVIDLDLLSLDALEQAKKCDGVMCRYFHNPQDKQSLKKILYTIEHYLNIPIFPNEYTSWHFDEKVAQFYLFTSLGAPTPKTWVFWNYETAIRWASEIKYPVIWKLSSGAGSANVLKIENSKQAIEHINKSFKQGIFPYTLNEFRINLLSLSNFYRMIKRMKYAFIYIIKDRYPPLPKNNWKPEFGYAYFQEFLPDNEYDTRIVIIGDRAFGFRRMNRENDFRASGSEIRRFDPDLIDKKFIKIAFEITKKYSFQSMAYDFMYNADKEPVLIEISYTYPDYNIHKCSGYWNSKMDWIEGHMWPEEAQVEDFLEKIKSCNEKRKFS
jgi:glutathione synthase/RimK-type ligase-like ATP-grasp enzyme